MFEWPRLWVCFCHYLHFHGTQGMVHRPATRAVPWALTNMRVHNLPLKCQSQGCSFKYHWWRLNNKNSMSMRGSVIPGELARDAKVVYKHMYSIFYCSSIVYVCAQAWRKAAARRTLAATTREQRCSVEWIGILQEPHQEADNWKVNAPLQHAHTHFIWACINVVKMTSVPAVRGLK